MDSVVKSNDKAAQLRREGNQLYQQRAFDEALEKYNESICWAENGSEDLGIGFANRSAACYEQNDYEFALANIALARSHNYPERLMSKLEKREQDCRQHISQRPPQEKPEDGALRSRVSVNVEVNPRIPFIAKDIHVGELPGFGTAMIADRDFKVGDVIIHERPLLACAYRAIQYSCCDCCSIQISSCLIPCQRCVSVMYCGVECRQKGWKQYHRFECGLTRKLYDVYEKTITSFIAPRFFFYTLSLFNDDVGKMMKFFKAHPRTGNDPLAVDYVNYDPLEQLKESIKYKFRQRPFNKEANTYIELVALEYLKVLRQSTLVQSLFTTKGQMKFMQERFKDLVPQFPAFHTNVNVVKYYAISSILGGDINGKSNISVIESDTEDIIVVHQPVKKGSQLCFRSEYQDEKTKCPNCPRCTFSTDMFGRDFQTMCRVAMVDDGVNELAQLNALQQFLQKYGDMYAYCRYDVALRFYQHMLVTLMKRFLRLKLRDEAEAKAIA